MNGVPNEGSIYRDCTSKFATHSGPFFAYFRSSQRHGLSRAQITQVSRINLVYQPFLGLTWFSRYRKKRKKIQFTKGDILIVISRDIYGYGCQMAPLAYSKSVFYSIFGRPIVCWGQIDTRTPSRGLKWRSFVFSAPFSQFQLHFCLFLPILRLPMIH